MIWPLVQIKDCCQLIGGGTPKSGQNEYWHGDVLWITPKDMGMLTGNYVSDTSRKITRLGLQKSSAKLIPTGSVILSTRAPIGHLALNLAPMATNQGCRGLVPSSSLNPKFLFYFLRKSIELLNDLGSGTTFKELSKGALSKVEIPLPPINKQKRIVAILDLTFADIEKARDYAEQNLKNARELLESYLQQVFSQRGDGWVEKALKEVCKIKPPKKEAKAKLKDDDLVSFVPMNSLGIRNKNLNLEVERKLHEVNGSYTYFADNDVLLAKITPCFENGKLGLAKTLKNGVGFGSSEYIVFRCLEGLSPDFLYHYLSRQTFRDLGKSKMSGAVGHKRVAKEFIESHKICFPNIEKQDVIVNSIEKLMVEINSLESNYQAKIANFDELKKSILQKAFTGELTKEKVA